jgi:hypothetical protein
VKKTALAVSKKRKTSLFPLFIVHCSLLICLAACFSPWQGDKGTVTVTIGSPAGNGRAISWNDAYDEKDLTHEITLSGGPGHDQKKEVTGVQTVTFSVAPGRWNISVEAYAGNVRIAVGGPVSVEIKPGPNEPVTIEMRQPPSSVTYTVTFDKNGGIGEPPLPMTAAAGSSIKLPGAGKLTYNGSSDLVFGGWNTEAEGTGTHYAAGDSYTVNGDVTLWAKWVDMDEEDFGPDAIIDRIDVTNESEWNTVRSRISNGGNYIINVMEDFYVEGKNASFATFGSATDIKVSIRGAGKTLTQYSDGIIIRIGANQSVILRDLTLIGSVQNSGSASSLVYVTGANSTFTMHSGKISGNQNNREATGEAGGVKVLSQGTFTMNGGEISGNTGYSVGGVYLDGNGTFTMNGGEISGNTGSNGGGVSIKSGTFTMNDGEISGNEAAAGGGVYKNTGDFTMYGGEIFGNKATGTFSNPASSGGGGVHNFGGAFYIVTGIIYGSNEGEKSNTAVNNRGAALFTDLNKPQYGTFNGSTWVPKGDLNETDNTIKVVNGKLVQALTTVDAIAAYLASFPQNTADNPVPLSVKLSFGNGVESSNENWQGILTAISTAGRYVDLDLSACTTIQPTFQFDAGYDLSTGKDKIVNIVLPDTATSIRGSNSSSTPTFSGFTVLKSFSGTGLTYIGTFAFYARSSLVRITLPAGITEIGQSAFSACTSLVQVTCLAPTPPELGGAAFATGTQLRIEVPANSVNAYKAAAGWSAYADSIVAIE